MLQTNIQVVYLSRTVVDINTFKTQSALLPRRCRGFSSSSPPPSSLSPFLFRSWTCPQHQSTFLPRCKNTSPAQTKIEGRRNPMSNWKAPGRFSTGEVANKVHAHAAQRRLQYAIRCHAMQMQMPRSCQTLVSLKEF